MTGASSWARSATDNMGMWTAHHHYPGATLFLQSRSHGFNLAVRYCGSDGPE